MPTSMMRSRRASSTMLLRILALALALGCASAPRTRNAEAGPQAAAAAHRLPWGIMVSPGDAPAVFALTTWGPGTRLRAQRIAPMAESLEVSVGVASPAPDSPLYPDDGKESVQRYAVAEPKAVPPGTLWVCVPPEWNVRPIDRDRAALEVPGVGKGFITTALKHEGIDVTVQAGDIRETSYFYFGYAVQ